MSASDSDLDADFALFEQTIANVTAPAPTPNSPSPTSTAAANATGDDPANGPANGPGDDPGSANATVATSATSAGTTGTTGTAGTVSANQRKHSVPSSSAAPTAGKWKWTGTSWKWVTIPTTPSPSTPTSLPVSPSPAPPPTGPVLPPPPASPPKPASHPGPSNQFKRTAAGTIWTDPTLAEFPPNDYRLFVGDLAPDAHEAHLNHAFAKYKSFNMSRLVRDKRTGLCRGYGFLSFSHARDMVAALREMNGKYVGNRPLKLRKSNWQRRNLSKEKAQELKLMRQIAKR